MDEKHTKNDKRDECKDYVRIFNYPWHISHQYELLKLPNTLWSWLIQHRRGYSDFPRGPMADDYGVEWVPHYESGKYDIALLHLDQQCFEEGIYDRGKGSLTRDVYGVIGTDVPKVLLMHGTPFFPESYPSDITNDNYIKLGYTKDQVGMSSELIEKYKEFAKDFDALVFNSRAARRQWGFAPLNEGERDQNLTVVGETRHGTPQYAVAIWHGMEVEEWWDMPKEPRVITMINPAGLDAYYDRTFLRGVREVLLERGIHHCHITVDASFKNWDEYRNFIGRSLIYFNPTRESPMPRSRTEAMLSGSCIITTRNQDADQFIQSGVNGIIVPRNPEFVADLIEGLIYDYKKAVELGRAGKETAMEEFSWQQFSEQWDNITRTLTGKSALKK